jgi:glycosyltransferase involved in cell wall biosynthesis
MSDQYEFTHFNWYDQNHVNELWANNGWKNYDIILGNGTLSNINGLPPEAYSKMVCCIWSMPQLSSHFREIIIPRDGITWCTVGEDLSDYMLNMFNIQSYPILAGVSHTEFKPNRNIDQIKVVGLNGIPFVNPGWDEVKRPQMLVDIANGINGKAKFIHDKTLDESNTMYDNIDMFICTSTNDRGPYGIAEAAMCKIPVISTKTGFALKLKSIKTFDTVEEAVEIINHLNQSPEILSSYIEEVYNEVYNNLEWSYVANKYWKPIFENHLTLNKR